MKKTHLFGLFVSAVLMTACGGNSINPSSEEEPNTNPQETSFQIKDTRWSLMIPDNWVYVTPPQSSAATILLAQNQSSNFVLMQKGGPIPTVTEFQTQAQKDFYTYQFISSNDDMWQFQGQLSIEDSPRVFVQKVLPIPNTDNYLYGSCSYETSIQNVSDCETLLRNWIQLASINQETE